MSIIQKERLERLEKAAEKIGTEKDYYVRKINKKIERYIEDMEDLAEAMESSKDTSPTIPHEEVLRENGLL